MTTKIYKTSRGKQIDIGSLKLQNEHVRAVGNMGVNARGDRIDSQGNVIDPINKQVQRRIQKQTNVSAGPVHTSAKAMKKTNEAPEVEDDPLGPLDQIKTTAPESDTTVQSESTDEAKGLAAALVRAKASKTSTSGKE